MFHTLSAAATVVVVLFSIKIIAVFPGLPAHTINNAYCVHLIHFLFGFSLLMLRNARDRYGLHPRPSNHFTALLLETILNQSPVSYALIILGFSVLNCGCLKLYTYVSEEENRLIN